MNLEEIINAAVEKRVGELVEHAVGYRRTDGYSEHISGTQIERAVENAIERIAKEEVKKHEDAIRAAIVESLSQSPASFEISAYTKIQVPKKERNERYAE